MRRLLALLPVLILSACVQTQPAAQEKAVAMGGIIPAEGSVSAPVPATGPAKPAPAVAPAKAPAPEPAPRDTAGCSLKMVGGRAMPVPMARGRQGVWPGALLAVLALSGCVAGEAVMQETTRSLARGAVDAAAGRYLPGVDVSPYTDCVINNASTDELLALARAAGAGAAQDVATQAWPVVRTVASRPEATQCLVQSLSAGQLLAAQGLAAGGL
ncbi:MAG: hypothetical protein R3D63_10945 [Paracoccaceae bacterium]